MLPLADLNDRENALKRGLAMRNDLKRIKETAGADSCTTPKVGGSHDLQVRSLSSYKANNS